MILSILICTLEDRLSSFMKLLRELHNQIHEAELQNEIEIESESDNGEMSIGKKRQKLLNRAKGDFIVFIDDDDYIMPSYIAEIAKAIKENPDADCIGIEGCITFNGINRKHWKISKDFGSWYEKDGVYYRTPNHISPVRREIAMKAGFIPANWSEDYEYSKAILPHLKKEAYIPKELYHYNYQSKK